jgi:hypothetical protein
MYRFVYIEILEDVRGEKEIQNSTKTKLTGEEKGSNKNNQKKPEENNVVSQYHQELIKLVKNAYEAMAGEGEWAYLAELGGQLNKLSPSFDSRSYGYKNLGGLIRAIGMFELKEIPHGKKPAIKYLYIKLKN